MNTAAIVIPDYLPLSEALEIARRNGGYLLTNGSRNCVCPILLPGYARVVGGGTRASGPKAQAA